jgi:Zn finger protein HypA/HybF involved in hydrogenase expression
MLIHVDVSTAVFLYVMSSLMAVFVLWVFFERKAVLPKFTREEADVWECSICAHTYVDSMHHEISQCPQCKSYNKKSPEDRLL